MDRQEAQELLDKYSRGLCSPEEKALVERWYLQEAAGQVLPDMQADMKHKKKEMWNAVRQMAGLDEQRRKSRFTPARVAVAASVLLAVAASLYFFTGKQIKPRMQDVAAVKNEIAPGGNKATLTLADGSKIILDNVNNGIIATQSGIHVRKSTDGLLVYEVHPKINRSGQPGYQKIETPKGGQYQVVLPDGSKVWLNAVSALRFPASFTGSRRVVELNGEAYFEVAKNKKMPFVVRAKGTEVLVTGTHFDVMAYDDENQSTTTLLEGSVQVSKQADRLTLNPGQQAVSSTQTGLLKSNVDAETAIAWKNGLFRFDNADIQTVMRQLSRWYDVSVEYKGTIPVNRFGGYISRNSNLSQVLKMLELSGVRFSVEGRKINVLS